MFSVCVCVFWDQNAYHFFDERCFERSKCCLDPWLSCMFNCIHVCVFLFIEKLFLKQSQQLLDTSQYLAYLLKAIEKLSRLLKNSFSRKWKTQIWMQSSVLLNQRSNQHFKLSKTSLNTKNVKHIDPKTHTHTHTKQF